MASFKKLKLGGYTLCTPTYIYLILSLVSFLFMIASNLGPTPIMYFVIKVLIWVFLLNLMCANGLIALAWFFVLLPFIVMFIYLIADDAKYKNHRDKPIILEIPAAPQVPTMAVIRQM